MSRSASNLRRFLRVAPRAAMILLMLAAPVLAVPSLRSGAGATIEAPAPQKTGMGLVLLVSLQRG
ncbi:hypothetical protein [Mesorhizobium sp. SP-1A]|uniref:hypothetical protein n=1 Tax=Mesorhizobium sp. SP-1A TaxID=3077840 RepID=UPI0028F74811|nr:hypothetical protein [Mesorhizobium sp. SP-1A]